MSIEALSDVDGPLAAGLVVLGSLLTVDDVSLRIVEVEAYGGEENGPWPDSAAHSYRGLTSRNRIMFERAGLLYVYRSYGIHLCMNISYGPAGVAGGVLLRAAEIESGHDVVATRRPASQSPHRWAAGPGNLGESAGITLSDNGTDVFDPESRIRLELDEVDCWMSGPRVGVSTAADVPWRLWIPNSAALSEYRRSPRAPAPS
ncbi:DNA-3-methyladenine glycosylase [Rhodococcus sp. 27YEA15]|uniref:DNA-3-methyladenine glycosylase n=1 Tax=Rhodococcus sp. 27YEA15 TaxID=3156259 RepID=UPI003C7BD66C